MIADFVTCEESDRSQAGLKNIICKFVVCLGLYFFAQINELCEVIFQIVRLYGQSAYGKDVDVYSVWSGISPESDLRRNRGIPRYVKNGIEHEAQVNYAMLPYIHVEWVADYFVVITSQHLATLGQTRHNVGGRRREWFQFFANVFEFADHVEGVDAGVLALLLLANVDLQLECIWARGHVPARTHVDRGHQAHE